MNSPFITRRVFVALLLLGALLPTAVSAATDPADNRIVAPQPRVRLERIATQLVPEAATVQPAAADGSDPAVLMKPIVVRDTPIASAPRPITDNEPVNFTVLKGGPAFKSQLSSTLIEWGLWPLANKDPAADYRTPRPHVEVQVVRIKW